MPSGGSASEPPSILYFFRPLMTAWLYDPTNNTTAAVYPKKIIHRCVVSLSWHSLSASTIPLLQYHAVVYTVPTMVHTHGTRMTRWSLQKHGCVSYPFLWDRLKELNLLCPDPNGGYCHVARHPSFIGLVQELFSKGLHSHHRGLWCTCWSTVGKQFRKRRERAHCWTTCWLR